MWRTVRNSYVTYYLGHIGIRHPEISTCYNLVSKRSYRFNFCRCDAVPYSSDAFGQFLNDAFLGLSKKFQEAATLPFSRDMNSLNPFKLVGKELSGIAKSFEEAVAVNHPVLQRAASYFLNITVNATHSRRVDSTSARDSDESHSMESSPHILPSQLKLAEIAELIHVASLLHDDVIDVADTRRGVKSVNALFGNQLSVLAGDFLLSRASVSLARLRNCDVVELLSTVIEHLVHGEVLQMTADEDNSKDKLEVYLQKTFLKTASLIANSCQAVALLSNCPKEIVQVAFEYGRHLGLAYQLVDDALDFTGTSSSLGKPALADIHQGTLTAPVLFAIEQFPEIREYAKRRFQYPDDISKTLGAVEKSKGIERTLDLAKEHCCLAKEGITQTLQDTSYRQALLEMADFVLTRKQ
ncbi:Solanesyl-diphosphate synthase 1, mitochondrial [Galdieria sulphuraria]|nr:Solanesyl-diphosphate synthase 1, mitochondrial [Galdieria sulphuraria]